MKAFVSIETGDGRCSIPGNPNKVALSPLPVFSPFDPLNLGEYPLGIPLPLPSAFEKGCALPGTIVTTRAVYPGKLNVKADFQGDDPCLPELDLKFGVGLVCTPQTLALEVRRKLHPRDKATATVKQRMGAPDGGCGNAEMLIDLNLPAADCELPALRSTFIESPFFPTGLAFTARPSTPELLAEVEADTGQTFEPREFEEGLQEITGLAQAVVTPPAADPHWDSDGVAGKYRVTSRDEADNPISFKTYSGVLGLPPADGKAFKKIPASDGVPEHWIAMGQTKLVGFRPGGDPFGAYLHPELMQYFPEAPPEDSGLAGVPVLTFTAIADERNPEALTSEEFKKDPCVPVIDLNITLPPFECRAPEVNTAVETGTEFKLEKAVALKTRCFPTQGADGRPDGGCADADDPCSPVIDLTLTVPDIAALACPAPQVTTSVREGPPGLSVTVAPSKVLGPEGPEEDPCALDWHYDLTLPNLDVLEQLGDLSGLLSNLDISFDAEDLGCGFAVTLKDNAVKCTNGLAQVVGKETWTNMPGGSWSYVEGNVVYLHRRYPVYTAAGVLLQAGAWVGGAQVQYGIPPSVDPKLEIIKRIAVTADGRVYQEYCGNVEVLDLKVC